MADRPTYGARVAALRRACRMHGICLVYLFGSRKDEALRFLRDDDEFWCRDPLADIDVGVVFERPLVPEEPHRELYVRVYDSMAAVFGDHDIDLVFLQEQHSVFQAEAIGGHCVYCSDRGVKQLYEEMILRRAADFRPFLQAFNRDALAQLNVARSGPDRPNTADRPTDQPADRPPDRPDAD